MKKKIFNFLKTHGLTDAEQVNSLLISAFLLAHNITVNQNGFLRKIIAVDFLHKPQLLHQIREIIQTEGKPFDLEMLIQLFEFVISPSTRIINGAVYTPKNIRSFIIENIIEQKNTNLFLPTYKFADLSCGCGAFLIDIARELKNSSNLSYFEIFKNNIYGIDIEDYAIERSKILLTLLAITSGEDKDFEFNLIAHNSLTFDWNSYIKDFNGFDVIVGNPPYVAAKHMSNETKQQLSTMQTCQSGKPDLYIPFFEIGIKNLAPNGQLGFITMNSFFKSLNARNLRQYFQEASLKFEIIDFGSEQIFQSRNTYTCICLIHNRQSPYINYTRIAPTILNEPLNFKATLYSDLDAHNGWNLYAHELIKKIEQTGVPLGNKFRSSHGLATLKNDIYIFTPTKESDNFFYLQTKEGKEYLIEKALCMPVINSNKLSRKATVAQLKEQLIFPYTNEQKPKLIDEAILCDQYPKAYKYLCDHQTILATRDKGKGQYQNWYAFGRSQGLEQIKYKMFFPKYSDAIPHYLLHSDEQTYFYNGQAFLGESIRELKILKKILETNIFWFYITSTSKPYSSNYYSLNGTYIKNFGICSLSKEEEDFILSETNQIVLNKFFEDKYQIDAIEI